MHTRITMKTSRVLTLALLIAAGTVFAAEGDQPKPEGQGEGRQQNRQRPPLFAALDANNDGVIDEVEINQAAEHLRKLDKNGDGKISEEELRPAGARPPGGSEAQGDKKGPKEGKDGKDGERPKRGRKGPPEGDKKPEADATK